MDAYAHNSRIPKPTPLEPELYPTPGELNTQSPTQPTDRVLVSNHSQRIVVCSPDVPTIVRSTPVFTHLSVGTYTHDAEQVERVLDAVEAYLQPAGVSEFRYGIKVDTDQLLSDTPARFIEDIAYLEDVRTGEARSPNDEADILGGGLSHRSPVTIACLWPVEDGWFYAEGSAESRPAELVWEYGLLCDAPRTDLTEINQFFTQFADKGPRAQRQWPYRYLHAIQSTFSAPIGGSRIVETELAKRSTGSPPAALIGHNPYYGGPTGTAVDKDEQIPSDIAVPLGRTSTFVYEMNETPHSDTAYSATDIFAVEPPTTKSLFVCAKAKTTR